MSLPKVYSDFSEKFPNVFESYENLGNAVHSAGNLDEKTRCLVKLALSTAIGSEGAVHSHTRKCIQAGISKEDIRQVILLAIPTIGFPKSMAAMSWVDDMLEK
jgi:4-carboxymuconolactone decarboxylase